MSLGEEEAAEVFKHLAPKEVQRLGETIAKMKSIPRERVDGVLEKFTSVAAEQSMLVTDTDEYVQDRAAQGARRRQGQPADRPHPAGRRRHAASRA